MHCYAFLSDEPPVQVTFFDGIVHMFNYNGYYSSLIYERLAFR